MKTVLTAIAFAALAAVVTIGSPTLGQVTSEQSARSALDAYAQAKPRKRTNRQGQRRPQGGRTYTGPVGPDGIVHSTNPAHDVYGIDGEYIGSDPDPFIRGSLRTDPPGNSDDD